jgi:hypothetical protein
MSTCNPDKIKAALHEEADIVTDIVREKIVKSDRMALRMIPDGGVVDRHDNNDTIIYGEARQASRAYNELTYTAQGTPRGSLVAGEMRGRKENGASGLFSAQINDIADNACHGQCEIDFAQGFRRRGTVDYGLDLTTPIKCARELDGLGKEHITGFFTGFKNQFSMWGLDNFSDNLLNLVIQKSESNASVLGANQFNVTTGGWQAPPTKRISIHFLQDYKDHIKAEMKGRGMEVGETWKLEVEMPMDDWLDAVKADQIARNPADTTSYNTELFKDEESVMRGRQFADYGGIRCYFTDEPIRGYFVQTAIASGNPVYNFVRVYPWINKQDEEGGIVTGVNHQYRQDEITVDGVSYDMCTLMPHIDPRSFKRYGLMKPLKPIGSPNEGVNYQVKVIDGAHLGCNDFNDKFKLVARHEFRFKSIYPEFSGFIAYRHGRRAGYAIEVTPRNYAAGPNTPANPERFDACHDDTGCQTAECAQCGKVPGDEGECVEPSSTSAVLNLEPCGSVESVFLGDAYNIVLRVTRTGDTSAAASVAYATANGTATAGADYTATSGTLTWEAGDDAPKDITVPILAGFTEAVSGTADTFTVTISAPVGDTLGTCQVATVSVSDLS